MTDHPRNPQPNAIIIVPIAGTLSNKTTPADFRRFAAIAHRRGICTEHPVPVRNAVEVSGTQTDSVESNQGTACDEITHPDTAEDH